MKNTPIKHQLLVLFLSSLVVVSIGACSSLSNEMNTPGTQQVREHAKKGDAKSQYRMGLLYTTGENQNYKKAAKWFRKAARQGDSNAQYMLGISYYVGQGVSRNYATARNWFQKAADQDHARAQYQLGEIYMNGRGVPKEPAWAALWYGKAAEQKHVEAQFSMGVVFARGLGLPINQVRSCQWLLLAEQSGHKTAPAVREVICTTLSDDQQSRATDLATGWKKRTYPPYQDPASLRYIQFRLQQLGYDPGYVDGVNGQQTRSTVEKYLAETEGNNEAESMQGVIILLRQDARSH